MSIPRNLGLMPKGRRARSQLAEYGRDVSHQDDPAIDDAAIDAPQDDTASEPGAPDLGDNVLPFPTAPRPEHDEGDEPNPVLRDVIGDVLRDERLDQDRTLADVADDAAVSLPYLSEIERGRKEVSSDVLDAIIRSLDLDLAEVLERAADRLRANELRMRSNGRSPQPLLLAA